ncbi:YdcF family protein [Octadecabacter sp. B2R22]|nr:YdcF family protein [Octadecabacter sp. B2R22]
MTAAMLAWTFLWPKSDMADLKQADAIVCLGGGMSSNGTLGAPVLTRIERCVQLYEAGLAPVILFTGGTATPEGVTAGGQMGRYAVGLGLPVSAVVEEGRAQSTLQNALFSLGLIPEARSLIVVTEAFHLPRSWASFHWASWELNQSDVSVALVKSEDVRRDPITGSVNWNILFRESIAIWFNGLRATAYSISPHKPLDWLH